MQCFLVSPVEQDYAVQMDGVYPDDFPGDPADFLPIEFGVQERLTWVFVSHSAADYEIVRKLLPRELEQSRYLTFHIANRAQPQHISGIYKLHILSSLARCGWFIVAVSEGTLRSKWVQFEVGWWLHNKGNRRLLCLILDQSNPDALDERLSASRKVDVRRLVRRSTGLLAKLERWRLRVSLPRASADEWSGDWGR